ncbi:WXG100 family type VII secretion target [Streptomyces sp. NPDC058960]|uniref:WXG100 family type VII secretion target n=1 Tax=Streptomyces sp. NPDC058960 TaxID=3346679 RepID=UPI0036B200B3
MVYGGEYYNNPEYIKAQEQAREQRIKDKHDEKLESLPNGGMGGPDRSEIKTPFMKMGIPELRSMILDADPNRIYEVSQHWKSVHNILSGGDGDAKSGGVDQVSAKDSVAGMMQSAVENVLEHWEGEAAEAFRKKANEILQNIRNGAAWANHYAETMHAVQNDLRTSMEKMRDVKEPSGWDRAWDKLTDDGRSDKQLLEDINKGVSTDAARQANADSLSKGKEEQLKGVAIMEQLAVNYRAYTKVGGIDEGKKDPFSPPNPSTPMPPPITMPPAGGTGPGAGGGTPKPWSAGPTASIKPTTGIKPTPTVPRDPGIVGGSQIPTAKTNIDSLSPGLTGTGPSPSSGGLSGGGGGIGIGGAQSPGIVAPGGGLGVGGSTAGRGGIAGVGARGGATGGAAAGRGAGGRAGMGGMGGGAGAAGRGGAGIGGRGALAKARGGVVGAAKGVGKGTGGGAGLHGSRGGTQRGGKAGAMAGGAGGRNGRRSEEENTRGERPDYLVEDEETWISEEDRNRNVPRTIE